MQNKGSNAVEKRYAEWSQMVTEVLGWYEQLELTQLTIKKRPSCWSMIIKGRKKDRPVVVFIDAHTYHDLWVLLGAGIKTGQIRWKEDKYPPDMGA